MVQNTKILQGHEGAIYKIVFDQVNRKLYSAGGDGWLVEWDPDHSVNGTLLAQVPDQIFALEVTPEYYLIGSFQGNFYVLDRVDKTILHQERVHKHGIFSILATEENFFTFGGDGRIVKWDIDGLHKKAERVLSSKSLRVQALSPSGSQLAVGASDTCIFILGFPELHLHKQIESAHDPSVFTLCWNGNRLISGGRDALIKSWKTDEEFMLDQSVNAHWYAVYDLAVMGKHLISCSRDKTIRWWNKSTLDPLFTVKWGDVMEAHVHSVNSLAVDEEKHIVYSGSEDRTIRGWVDDIEG